LSKVAHAWRWFAVRFRDRSDAGQQLADRLMEFDLVDPVVLGLPRGGVPVAAEIGARLGAPLEVFVARKIGAPGHQELGIGAVAEGYDGLVVSDTALRLGLDQARMRELADEVQQELQRRVGIYRGGRRLPELAGREVILVDDGVATGVTAEAALRALRARRPRTLILAVPACSREAADRLAGIADEVVCVVIPRDFGSVGEWYDGFEQTSDKEVAVVLARAQTTTPSD
jgi:putative phosphoribosyl transferase